MDSFIVSLVMVFLAQMCGRTQFVALAMAGRYKPRLVVAGVAAASAVVHFLSVAAGALLGSQLPAPWISYLAGLTFFVFGIWTLRGETEVLSVRRSSTPFLVVFRTYLSAQMASKTMMTAIAIAAQNSTHVKPVWIGSTLGTILADALAISIVMLAGWRMPEKPIRWTSASVFLLFGLWSIWTGVRPLPTWSWALGAVILGVALVALFGSRSKRRLVRN